MIAEITVRFHVALAKLLKVRSLTTRQLVHIVLNFGEDMCVKFFVRRLAVSVFASICYDTVRALCVLQPCRHQCKRMIGTTKCGELSLLQFPMTWPRF